MPHTERRLHLSFYIGLLFLLGLFGGGLYWSMPVTQWVMINVNDTPAQADAHVIQSGKTTIMIDVGREESAAWAVIPYLKSARIDTLDTVFISHPHKDHYDGLKALIDAGIRMKEVFFFMPYKSQCDGEIPWGCDYVHLRNTLASLQAAGSVLRTAQAGTRVDLAGDATLRVLHAYDGFNTPVGTVDVNDLSLIMRLEHGPTSVLFTGDLNNLLGEYLAKHKTDMKATLLKAPHHGAEGTAPDGFYETVAAEQVLVPAPALLWCSERSARTRNWFASRNLPSHVNGLHGHVSVLMNRFGYRLKRQVETPNNICKLLEGR